MQSYTLELSDLTPHQIREVADFMEGKEDPFVLLSQMSITPVIEEGEPDRLIGFEPREKIDAVVD